jgi:hypothetical protein
MRAIQKIHLLEFRAFLAQRRGRRMLPVALPAGSAPVSEKRIGLNRGPPAWAMGIGWGSSAFPRRDVLARGRCVARCHGRMGRGLGQTDGWRMVRALAGGPERPPRWPSDSRVRPLYDAGRVDGPEPGDGGAHEVSHTHRRLPACARTSMTTMVPWRQAGQSVSDVPVRDKCSAR